MKDKQFEPVSVFQQLLTPQSSPLMTHDFYEFVFFAEGRGMHTNHQIEIEFSRGELFVVKPGEAHAFHIEEATHAFVVRYTEPARTVLKEMVANSNGRAVALAKAKSLSNPKVSFTGEDETLVLGIFQLLLQLYGEPVRNESLLYYQLLCLIAVIERNLAYPSQQEAQPVEKNISRILSYIHKHLQDPEMLTLSHIAAKFNMSSNLLGLYFKKQTGQPVKQYINQCRLEIIGKKVAASDVSFSEIADQFGYVDESHFYKSFRKFYGKSPSDYRKAKR